MNTWQKIVTAAGGISTVVACLVLVAPYIQQTASATTSVLTTPQQVQLLDSIVHSYADDFFAKDAYQDSILNALLLARKASHMHSVGLRADSNATLWYRDRFNDVHRVLYDSVGQYYYAKTENNKLIFHYCFKHH